MKKLLVLLARTSVVLITTSSQATLLLYDPFDYTAGERLGGAGTNPVGKVAPNGQTWITRSPAVTPRIFSVVDVWDALIYDRPDRKGIAPAGVKKIITEQSGSHFDPNVVDAFFALDHLLV